jgi:hypothetical protein
MWAWKYSSTHSLPQHREKVSDHVTRPVYWRGRLCAICLVTLVRIWLENRWAYYHEIVVTHQFWLQWDTNNAHFVFCYKKKLGKVHPKTDYERTDDEQTYNSTLALTSAPDGGG